MGKIIGMMVLTAALQTWAVTVEGNVDPQKLLNWVDAQKNISSNIAVKANGKKLSAGTGFCIQCSDENSKPTSQAKTISLYQTSSSVFFDADMDIDCDGSNNGVCGGTDPSHQNLLSCDDLGKCSKDNGGPIDASGTPFFVIPIGSPFNYKSRGIGLGQVAAIINRKNKSIIYAPFLDEDGVSQEIGEASAKAASLLGVPNDPDNGGQASGIVYIVFRGSAGKLSTIADMANHAKAISVGQALAAKLLTSVAPHAQSAEGILNPEIDNFNYRANLNSINIGAEGRHVLSILLPNGQIVMEQHGSGAQEYDLSPLKPGLYIVKLTLPEGEFTEKIVR